MPAGIGVKIQDDKIGLRAMQDEVGRIVGLGGHGAKNALPDRDPGICTDSARGSRDSPNGYPGFLKAGSNPQERIPAPPDVGAGAGVAELFTTSFNSLLGLK